MIGEAALAGVQLRAGQGMGNMIGAADGFKEAIVGTVVLTETTEAHFFSRASKTKKINAEDAEDAKVSEAIDDPGDTFSKMRDVEIDQQT